MNNKKMRQNSNHNRRILLVIDGAWIIFVSKWWFIMIQVKKTNYDYEIKLCNKLRDHVKQFWKSLQVYLTLNYLVNLWQLFSKSFLLFEGVIGRKYGGLLVSSTWNFSLFLVSFSLFETLTTQIPQTIYNLIYAWIT